jgi:hypothetical protein
MATNNVNNQSNPITVGQGGTGANTLTQYGVLVGNGTGGLTSLAVGSNNSVLVGTSSTAPAFSTSANLYLLGLTINSGTQITTYKQGTFSPTIINSGSAPTITYNYQLGRYTKIGTRVVLTINISLLTYTAGTGSAEIGALPFASNTTANNQPQGVLNAGYLTFSGEAYYVVNLVANSTSAFLTGLKSASGSGNLAASGLSLLSTIQTSMAYEASS